MIDGGGLGIRKMNLASDGLNTEVTLEHLGEHSPAVFKLGSDLPLALFEFG